MNYLESLIGMPWPLAMAVVATTLILADLLFVDGDFLTYWADIIYTVVIIHFIPTNNFIWLGLFGVIIYLGVLLFHLLVWRKMLGVVFNRYIAPDKEKSLNEQLIGRVGEVLEKDGQWFIHIDDEFLQCTSDGVGLLSNSKPFKAKITGQDRNCEKFVVVPVEENSI